MSPAAHVANHALPLLALVTLGYFAACAFWPFGRCRRCEGTGRLNSPSRRFHRLCPRCDGTGRRVRGGRRLWTYLRNEHDRGSK